MLLSLQWQQAVRSPAGLQFSDSVVKWSALGPLQGIWEWWRLWDFSVSSEDLSLSRPCVQEEVHESL